jgi:uncharacterized membrane protein
MLFQVAYLALLFVAIDAAYLTSISGHFRGLVRRVQGGREMEFDLLAVAACYVALVFAIWYFIIQQKKGVWEAALLGWSIYAVYETTNKATLKDWSWQMVIMDTLWGGVLFALTTWIYSKTNHFIPVSTVKLEL